MIISGAVASQAGTQTVSTNDPAAVKAGTYEVDAYHTQIVFSLSHFGFTDFYGLFFGYLGQARTQPGATVAIQARCLYPGAVACYDGAGARYPTEERPMA